ncbi:FAD-dependent monooxygenase [Micromonospora sp. NBC_00389]
MRSTATCRIALASSASHTSGGPAPDAPSLAPGAPPIEFPPIIRVWSGSWNTPSRFLSHAGPGLTGAAAARPGGAATESCQSRAPAAGRRPPHATRLRAELEFSDTTLSASGRPSRALAVQPRTLEVLASLGVTDEMVAVGNRAVRLRLHARGRARTVPLFDLGLSGTAYPYLLFLSQAETERILGEHLAAVGLDIERGVELVGLDRAADGAVAMLRHGRHSPGPLVPQKRRPLRHRRLIPLSVAVEPAHLPRNGRRRPSQPARDRPQRLTRSPTQPDLFPLQRAQP